MKIIIATSTAAAAILLAGCGRPAPKHTSAPVAAVTSAPAAPSVPAVTCAQLSSVITTLVSDQTNQDKTSQEKWVMGNQGGDLQAAINATSAATSGSASQLTNDAAQFNSDATTYLADNSPYLAPGWEAGYNAVKADIAQLATDCGIPHNGM